jgi:hypothetical protein
MAWVLIIGLGSHAFAVSGIASQAACEALAKEINSATWVGSTVRCIAYPIAKST